jgi:general nucleoside transport system permease protein
MANPYAKLPRWVDIGLLPAVNVTVGFLVAGLVVVFLGENPWEALKLLVGGALGSGRGIGSTLYFMTSFTFTGLAVAVAFHAGLFNIGGEGQAYIGGLGVAIACLSLDPFVPWYVTFPFAVMLGMVFGAAWAAIPAYLQAKRGSHIVITTIMFNFIAASLMVYLLVNWLKPPASMDPSTRLFTPDGGMVPTLRAIWALFGARLSSPPVNITFFLALASAFGVWLLIWRTKLGYEIRAMGLNPTAAQYAGVSIPRITIITMLISGALAGMLALNTVMGNVGKLTLDFVGGAGFVGIAVALMGRSHPVGVLLAALLFGILYQGGSVLSFQMPAISRDMIIVIQALVILFAGALENLFRPALAAMFAGGTAAEAGAR